jgi:hypothetical protein
MVDKKDKKKKAKKTPKQKQKQKQKQSVVVNVNMTKPATRRRTLAKKTSDNRPLPPTPQAYGIPVQQSVQPSLNNITEYLKQKEGQENNRHVNILSAMKAIQRDEGQQATVTQTERAAGTSTQAPRGRSLTMRDSPDVVLKKKKHKLKDVGKPQPGAEAAPVNQATPVDPLEPPKKERKERSDKGQTRGPLVKTAAEAALAQGAVLVTQKKEVAAAEGEQGGAGQSLGALPVA